MPIEVPANSRFKLSTPIVTADGAETFGLMTKFDFLANSVETIDYVVKATYAHRPDLIANAVYGSPSFYWVVIMFNRPRNPMRWPEVGEVIRLPVTDEVLRQL